MKVLIIDDEKDMTYSIEQILTSAGFDCLSFSDPFRALEAFQHNQIDVLISDVQIPGLNGMDLFRLAKRSNPLLKVIYISGYFAENSVPESDRSCTLAFLQKPFHIEDIIKTLETFLKTMILNAHSAGLSTQG